AGLGAGGLPGPPPRRRQHGPRPHRRTASRPVGVGSPGGGGYPSRGRGWVWLSTAPAGHAAARDFSGRGQLAGRGEAAAVAARRVRGGAAHPGGPPGPPAPPPRPAAPPPPWARGAGRPPPAARPPPPAGGRFRSAVRPISPAVRARMGATWRPGCPVVRAALPYVAVNFHGFDGRPHPGELVVNERVAAQVVSVFARLYRARFPIEAMRLVTTADLKAHPTGDGNNTAAFTCRAARKQTRWSAHAYGLAVDVTPFQNPYRRGDLVLPELAGAYLDRGDRRPGMIRPDGVVTRAFA